MPLAMTDAGMWGERIAIILGFTTLVLALATFASCRSCLSFLNRLGLKNPMDTRWYRPFYKYHGYYWWGFLLSLFPHMIMSLIHTEIPTIGDPDASTHLIILSFALGNLIMTGTVVSSCRSLVGLLASHTKKPPLSNITYKSFYMNHSYYWLALLLLIAAHFATAYAHAGIWPA